jgi:hypothetical protein
MRYEAIESGVATYGLCNCLRRDSMIASFCLICARRYSRLLIREDKSGIDEEEEQDGVGDEERDDMINEGKGDYSLQGGNYNQRKGLNETIIYTPRRQIATETEKMDASCMSRDSTTVIHSRSSLKTHSVKTAKRKA